MPGTHLHHAESHPTAVRRAAGASDVSRWLQAAALATAFALAFAVTAAYPAQSAHAAVVQPKPPVTLPVAVDDPAPYLPQRSCNPTTAPGVAKFRDQMMATYKRGRNGGTVRACNVGGSSEHKEGRAWDWMLDVNVPADKAVADAYVAWLTRDAGANARRVGIMYVIWNKRIWATYNIAAGWRAYSGALTHTDHVHVSFAWNGAYGRTSWFTGKVGRTEYGPCVVREGELAPKYTSPRYTPCPAPLPKATPKPAPTPTPKASPPAQPAPAPVPTTKPKPVVVAASPLARYYGTVARPGSKGTAVRVLQATLGMPAKYQTGNYATLTKKSVVAFQKKYRLSANAVFDRADWAKLDAVRYGAVAGRMPTVRSGSKGAAVKQLQTSLRMPVADRTGTFATRTKTAVVRFQKAQKLSADGIVGPLTWKKLGY